MRASVDRMFKLIAVAGLVPCMALFGCAGEDGADGEAGTNGVDGTSCTVASNGDGTSTISCDDGTTATVTDGVACSVTDNGDGTTTLTCGSDSATVSDGEDGEAGAAGTSCTVADNGDGTATITCGADTATLADGEGCTVETDGATTTVICGDDNATIEGIDPAVLEEIEAQLDLVAGVGAESCVVCHGDQGTEHQTIYDDYADTTDLVLNVTDVTSTDNGDGTFDAVMTMTITLDGMPYVDADGLPNLDQKRFYTVKYDPTTKQFTGSQSFGGFVATATPGEYNAFADAMAYAPEDEDAIAYGYIASGELDVEAGGHITLYDDVSNAGLVFNNGGGYDSNAVVSGCEKCHGEPYLKHGFRGAEATNLPDFAACKVCHFDDRQGGHEDWQILVDDPLRYAEIHDGADLTADEETKYAYIANVMNDTHMSHAMEFPYPQSIANCVTCHEGKLDKILADEFFTVTTCKSCHPVTGSEDYGTAGRALETLMPTWHDIDTHADCASCHNSGTNNPVFSDIHTGYDKIIYADDQGTRYRDLFYISIDGATLDGNTLTVNFSVIEDGASTVAEGVTDALPTLMVGLYGWDTKDYLVGPHERDDNGNRLLEMDIADGETNPRFTIVSMANGVYEVDIDLSMWEGMIADGAIKRAEIGITAELPIVDGDEVALDAVSRTFDLASADFDDGYFDDIVDVAKCEACHDALATNYHNASRGGSIRVCRLCHITKNGGSHLEMQSRSIDSYIHAIHSYQPFDSGDVDMTDPVEKVRYELHIEHNYPNFTIKNCQSCHNDGTFEVPDQAKSMPGVLSRADSWDTERNIGAVPSYVTGPAARSCGACHRVHYINEDAAGHLAGLNAHFKSNGYLIEASDGVLDAVFEAVFALF